MTRPPAAGSDGAGKGGCGAEDSGSAADASVGAPAVLVCRCCWREDVIPPQTRTALEPFGADRRVWLVDDLCGLAARRDGRLLAFARQAAPLVVACHERAVRALFEAAGAPLPEAARVLNLRVESSAVARTALAAALAATPDGAPGCGQPTAPQMADDAWHPWFPVIDRSRCTNCGQCLNFCLFGVYALDAQRHVTVQQPRSCKTNCPACARICPSVAIIFPKYDESPINGGPIEDEAAQRERVRVDTQEILGSDVYEALRRRQAKRSLFTEQTRLEQEQKARQEREAWLKRESQSGQGGGA